MAVSLGRGLFALLKASAIIPVSSGESAAPLDSIKYWMDIAVLLISGRATSFTVDVTFGEDMGINSEVKASIIPKAVLFSTGLFNVINNDKY